MLAESEPGQLFVQFPGGSRSLGKYEKAFHRLIEAVDDGEVGRLFSGIVFMDMVFQNTDHIGGSYSAALGWYSGRFDTNDDVLVFI